MESTPDEEITGQVVGPFPSGSDVAFSCESGGGKPSPSISWLFGDEVLEGETTATEDVLTGDITTKSLVEVTLEREHSGAQLQCL